MLVKVRLVGDVNGDGMVNIEDTSHAAKAVGATPRNKRWIPWVPCADIDNNGRVDIMDIALIAKNFGKKCT